MKRSAPESVLVVCVRYLGDTLLLRPCLRAIRSAFPSARIDAVVARGTSCALEGCADVSRVIEWPSRNPVSEAAVFARLLLAGYDWAVDFTGNDRTALIVLASRARMRAAYERPKLPSWSLRRAAYNFRPAHRKSKPHVLIQRLELLEACGVPPQGFAFGLRPEPAAVQRLGELLQGLPGRILHAHVTSRDMQKAIPADVVREVLDGAIRMGFGVVVTGGPAEIERRHVARCTDGLPRDKCRVFHELDWQGLVAAISRCTAYWGSDTAPAHIAAALEKPMLIEFGPSRADHWSPLHAEGRAAVWNCACQREKAVRCPGGIPGKCLERIQARDVLSWLQPAA